MKVSFYVQREIVSGLRYEQKTSRKGIQGKMGRDTLTAFILHLIFIFMTNKVKQAQVQELILLTRQHLIAHFLFMFLLR